MKRLRDGGFHSFTKKLGYVPPICVCAQAMMRLPKCDDAYRHLVPKVAKRTKESCVTVGLRMCITNQSGTHVCYMNIVGNGRACSGHDVSEANCHRHLQERLGSLTHHDRRYNKLKKH